MRKLSLLSRSILLVGSALLFSVIAQAQNGPPSPKELETALAAKLSVEQGDLLAQRIKASAKPEDLKKGLNPRVDGLTVSWAIEAPGAGNSVRVASRGSRYSFPLTRLGNSEVYATAVTLHSGAGLTWVYEAGNTKLQSGNLEVYTPEPETRLDPNVPKGQVTKLPVWKSKIFADTERDWWIYVPAQYKPENPACVMIFQDGGGYVGNVPTVFDNLIARGDMPITIGIFINPGHFADNRPNSERSFEYDTLSDQYSRFILEEILPEVEKTYKLKHDPASRAAAGISSGGICAFTLAWQRPDQFSKVLSWVGSFTDIAGGKTLIEGGHNYPFLIRRTDPKPIRVFLQDGGNDLDNVFGNWPLANQSMAKALAFKNYDYTFVFGEGFHSAQHGQSMLPSSLRWLWRGYGQPGSTAGK